MPDQPPTVRANWANPVVDGLENFYGLPVERVAEKLAHDRRRAADSGLDLVATVDRLRAAEFIHLHLTQQHSRPRAASGDALAAGHLRAALTGRELVPVPAGGRRNVLLDGKHFGDDRLPATLGATADEIKAALCYAHDLVLEDPFDEEQDLPGFIRVSEESVPGTVIRLAPDPNLFVANVAAVAALAPLVRGGVVRFSSRRLAMHPRAVGTFGSNAWHLERSAGAPDRELVDRMMRVWLHSGGTIVPMFSDAAQEQRFADLLGVLAQLVDRAESARLRGLGRLALPTAGGLDLARMVDIRQEPVFSAFRSRLRAVLAAVGDDTDDAHARAAFREEMRAAAGDVRVRSARGGLLSAMRPKLLGWSVGGIVGAAFDWRVAGAALAAGAAGKIADYLTSSTAQAVSDRSPAATVALHHHYATLGRPPGSDGCA